MSKEEHKRTRQDREIISAEADFSKSIDTSNIDAVIAYAKHVVERFPFTHFSILKGRRFSHIWQVILDKTSFLDAYFEPNSATRIYYFINKLDHIHVCETCGKPYVKQIRAGGNTPEYWHCNTFCAQQNPRVMQQIKSTKIEHGTTTKDLLDRTKSNNQKKYGVDWFFQTKDFEEKKLAAWKSNGYDHPMHSDDVKNEMKERLHKKYGNDVNCNFQIPGVKEKLIKINQKKYGVDWPMQNAELWQLMHDNSAKTVRRNFYKRVLVHIDSCELLVSEQEYVDMDRVIPDGCTALRMPLKWRCKKCGNVFTQFLYQYGTEPRCLKCNPLLYNRVDSDEEIDLFNFMSSVSNSNYECLRHSYWNWNLLGNGKMLDIVCIDKNSQAPKMAIEFNGVYWHSSGNKDQGYHLMKTKICEDIGIKLIHIWEDEWINDKANVKALLEKMLSDVFVVDTSKSIIELDRSKICKLWVPDTYEVIEEVAPSKHVHSTADNKCYVIEDCGRLICKRK